MLEIKSVYKARNWCNCIMTCCYCCCWVASVMSDSVQPHRRQPTRLHRPRDSPGKNTGVGCHFLLQCLKPPHRRQPTRLHHPRDFPGKCTGVGCHCLLRWKWKWCRSVVSDSLWSHGLQSTRLLCPWDFPGKCTGVGCHFFLQGIFLTQESNPGLLHCRQTLNPLSHQGSLLRYTIY